MSGATDEVVPAGRHASLVVRTADAWRVECLRATRSAWERLSSRATGSFRSYSSKVTESSAVEVRVAACGPVEVLQAVADPVRWAVLDLLAAAPRCVCRLQDQIPVAGNLLSYHLKVLREAGLITSARRGRWIDYALADDARVRMAAALPGAGVRAPALLPVVGS